MPYLFMIITLVTMVTAQILLRKGMLLVGEFTLRFDKIVPFFAETFTNPYIVSSVLLILISALSWMIAVSRAEISHIYPFMGLSFALVALFAWLILGESLGPLRWAGIIMICIGVFCVLR